MFLKILTLKEQTKLFKIKSVTDLAGGYLLFHYSEIKKKDYDFYSLFV